MNLKSNSLKGFILGLLSLLCFFSFQSVFAADTVVIGHITDKTGSAAPETPWYDAAVEFAVEEYGGMVAGKKIQVIHEDGASNPTTAVEKARKLVEKDKAAFIIGPINGGAAAPVTAYLGRFGIPHICMELFPALFKENGHLFAVQGVQRASGYILGKYAAEKLGHKTATAIQDDVVFADEFLTYAIKGFEEAGGKVVQRQRTPMNTMEYGSYLSGMKKADVVFMWMIPPHAIRFTKSYHEYGFDMPMVVTGINILSDHFLHVLGDDAVGMYALSYADAAAEEPGVKEWVARWEKRFANEKMINQVGMSTTISFYLQTKFALEALKATGGDTNPKALKKALFATKLDTPWGLISFDEKGMGIGPAYIMRVTKTGNRIHHKQIEKLTSRVRNVPE